MLYAQRPVPSRSAVSAHRRIFAGLLTACKPKISRFRSRGNATQALSGSLSAQRASRPLRPNRRHDASRPHVRCAGVSTGDREPRRQEVGFNPAHRCGPIANSWARWAGECGWRRFRWGLALSDPAFSARALRATQRRSSAAEWASTTSPLRWLQFDVRPPPWCLLLCTMLFGKLTEHLDHRMLPKIA